MNLICKRGIKGKLTKGKAYRSPAKREGEVFVKTNAGSFGWFDLSRFEVLES